MKSQPFTTVEPPHVELPLAQQPIPTPCQTNGALPPDHAGVARLLAMFDVATLGEGDVVAGANVLTAMACSLANFHRPGSGLVTEDGERLPVGTNLLVSGTHSASLVGEKITSGLAERQNNFIAHLRDWTLCAEMEMAKTPNRQRFNPTEILEAGASSALLDLHCDARISGLMDLHLSDALIQPPKSHGKRDLHNRPLVYITGGKPTELTKHLEFSHLGRPLIHVGIHDAAASSRFDECCTAVMDGTLTVGTLSETVRGFIIATDPFNTLANIIRASDGKGASWLMRTLWLTDSTAGPECGNITSGKATVKLDRIQARYDAAMDKAWVARLDYTNPSPKKETSDWPKFQAKWVAFLKGMEAELPGITGTARSLLATLVFGLRGLANAWKAEGFKWYTDDIAALARWLIRRMRNARVAMLHTEQQARIRRVAQRIALRLAEGPHSERELTRSIHRLLVGECSLALNLLVAEGLVVRSDERWQLSATGALNNFQTLATIDV